MVNQETGLGHIEIKEHVKDILLQTLKRCEVPSEFFFYDKYKYYPATISIRIDESSYFKYSSLLKTLQTEYGHDNSTYHDVLAYSYSKPHKKMYVSTHLCDLRNGVMFNFICTYLNDISDYIDDDSGEIKTINDATMDQVFVTSFDVYFMPNKKDFVETFIKTFDKKHFRKTAQLQMICKNRCGLYLNEIKIKEPKIKDLKINYGSEFVSIHEKILKCLREPQSTGIVLLHGLPGTGKTHYIRYLIQQISEMKQLIYVNPDMASCIVSPEFLPFMLEQKDSILIIEDAENIIKSREANGVLNSTQAVANLLNLSDGLLGDSLHQPIIATFNCELSSIDPALLRKGRLIAHHQFDKLSIENSQILSDSLGFNTSITEPMTLADIYGQQK